MSASRLRVMALAPYPQEAPSTRVRLSQYARALAGLGIDLDVRPFFTSAAYREVRSGLHWAERGGRVIGALADSLGVLRRAGDHDVVWVQRGIAPFLDRWALDALRDSGAPLVYDFDDAIYLPQEGGRAWVERLRDPAGVTAAFCASAAAVFAGNAQLAEFARSAVGAEGAGRISVIPSVVDTDRLVPRARRPAGPVVVGWMGSDSTVPYLESLAGALAQVAASKACRFVVVAGRRRPRLPGVDFSFLPWSQEVEAGILGTLDVGLYPLDDSPWSRGKCGYKAIQYLSSGVPCVAAPVGVLRDLVRPDETGLWAGSTEEWVSSIRTLAQDPATRARMAVAGRELVEARYSLRAYAPVVAGLLFGVVTGGVES